MTDHKHETGAALMACPDCNPGQPTIGDDLRSEIARHERLWREILNNSLMSEDAKAYARLALRIR